MAAKVPTIYDSVAEWCRTVRPDCAFAGRTRADWRRWRRAFLAHYRRMLGPWPERVPLRVRVVSRGRRPGYTLEKVLFDSSRGITVPAFLLVPAGVKPGERRPGILAAHGHGNGKADIAGEAARDGGPVAADVYRAYARQAVLRGFVVIAPDWIPFGERRPPGWWVRDRRDACDISSHAVQYFGRTLIAQNVWDGMRAVDVLAAHPNVDRRRLGVVGLSYGGTMTTHLLVNDRRLRAGVVSGYISTVRGDALNRRGKGNTCGAQFVPGLLRHGDIPEILGLASPKPVLCEIGRRETTFHGPDMLRAFRQAKRIWRAAGVPERLAADVHGGGHRWSGRRAWAWLERWLA
jgi:dienelactone hydrolase